MTFTVISNQNTTLKLSEKIKLKILAVWNIYCIFNITAVNEHVKYYNNTNNIIFSSCTSTNTVQN